MEKATRATDVDSVEEQYVLPSTFSPWTGHEDEPDFGHSRAQSLTPSPTSSPPPPERSKEHLSSYIAEDEVVRPPLSRRASPFRSTPTPHAQGDDEQLMLRPDDHGMQPVTETVISAGDIQQKRGTVRRTKFTELLSRSLSLSLLGKKVPSSPSIGSNYNTIAEEPSSHQGPEHYPMDSVNAPRLAVEDRSRPSSSSGSEDDDDIDIDELATKYERPPLDCHSRRDVYVKRWSWTFIILLSLSLYSTLLSGLWLFTSIYQPRYGRGISDSEGWKMAPSTATLLCTLIAKTIEMSFVTVFVAFIGQVLTRRAFVKKSKGVTLAEMTMRNWVIQPGSLLRYWAGVPFAATTVMGALSLIAAICTMFYTTASDAMVSPKLKYGAWESRSLEGFVKASYANPYYVQKACSTPIDTQMDPNNSAPSCLDVQYSGQSYHNLLTFMGEWHTLHENKSSTADHLSVRPVGKHNLFDNTTMASTWIETEFGDPKTSFATYNRIVNNVTLAMPHAGVYSAATDPRNNILQPDDLAGVGEYSIRASVVSPVVNVMCVNMARAELAPLVYTEWPQARTASTNVPGQRAGVEDWFNDVPAPSDTEWLNRTAVDDIFRWGPKYHRRPPVFQLYPIDYNMITNTSVAVSADIYVLAKSGTIDTFALCQLSSWVTPKCSTEFDVSGISGGYMRAHCEDPANSISYEAGSGNTDFDIHMPAPSLDWRNLADQWRLSMDLNGGVQNNNASNARIMAHLILESPSLNPNLPSMAEALAVLASSTLVAGTLYSTYRAVWDYPSVDMSPGGVYESFRASMRTQEYTSSHVMAWQAVFYAVLGFVFILNLACLCYIVFVRSGLVSDYTEPQNLFAVSVNSPASGALSGSCGHGPDAREMVVPWRVGYSAAANHYFFEEATGGVRARGESVVSGSDLLAPRGRYRSQNWDNYKRLSSSRTWL
ncbi:uncharacterized protein GGS22DRAFT_199935 [Annulohypoxylon maeteangense]|uniref:uncharacterized protein n=1 Tax=Annulohypoxylon maeteangense TaxID=1927788 RepID=UPI002008678C|nr:uncharacterized protein GGS22DRAFT_199935 [Annulohypoxylon maeteangense]KAI0885743.1 hypothetical protein GGS22DRAFT_199935 [Annulohypoxylon maeteangense]